MKLYDGPRQRLRHGGRTWRLRLDFRRVLRAMDAAADPLLTDAHRLQVMLQLLVRGPLPLSSKKRAELLAAVMALLTGGAGGSDTPPLTSLTQDAPLIIAAFRQAYGIDLTSAAVPWETFCHLLSGLPGDTRYGEVVALRARPLPEATPANAKYRAELLRAKAAVALDLTEEQRARSRRSSASRIAHSLFAWANAASKEGSL